MEIDVLCVGLATYDLVYQVDRYPGEDEKCFASSLLLCGGGPGANAAVTVARLGGAAAFAGYLANDVFGRMHLEELVFEGVRTDLIVRDEKTAARRKAAADNPCRNNARSALSSILVAPGGKRTVVTHKGTTPILEPEQVDFARFSPRAILFDGHQPALSVPLAQRAREQNTPTILDAGSVSEGTARLARLCSHLAASEKFARDFTGEKAPQKALTVLARMAPVAVITLGDAGLIYCDSRSSGAIAPFAVDAVDTTGAGDIFHGALALRTARGDDLFRALQYASAAAALGCEKLGARPAIPSAEAVESLLRSTG
ncbi:MAG: PfkB family carbohydrate kinase [Syntrophobacteraceae bacterium]|nr:PfkB family carbohydrate kinase [Syntrophobacteraceae bacterium]